MAEGLSTVLGYITTFLTSAVSWMTTVFAQITTEPILFIMVVAIPVSMVAFALIRRLMRL